jgi:hypothetical protein
MKGDEVTDLRSRVEALPRKWTLYGRALIERAVLALLDQPAPPDTALREALDAAVESAMRDLSGTNEELRTVEEAFQVGVGAGIAKMRRAVEALHDRYEETGMMTGHSAAWDMKDLLRLAATAPTPPDGLDVRCDVAAGVHRGTCDLCVGQPTCLNCNGTGWTVIDGARRPCRWDHAATPPEPAS